VSVATTNLHTGFALAFSAIAIPQLEQYDNEIGEISKSQLSWIGKIFFKNYIFKFYINLIL